MDYNIDEQPEEEQNFKAKYFKYKSKYLALKQQEEGGHANIYIFKIDNDIDNDNDLYYQQKYFKYKSKYLDIKYGGNKKTKIPGIGSNRGTVYNENKGPSGLPGDIKFALAMQETQKLAAKQQEDAKKAAAQKQKDIENFEYNKKILLDKLQKIIEDTPYKLELINCTAGKEKDEPNWFWGTTKHCPKDYYYNNYISSSINTELKKDIHKNKITDISLITRDNILSILDNPLQVALDKGHINSRSALKEYIIKKMNK
jgi:hypothetical protein